MGHLGVRAPYATRCKLRYEANQVWLNTTFILQGLQSWGKLAVETWRVKTELIIIITILHIIIMTTSILNLGFKTFAPKILAHTICIIKYWKYTQIFAATKSSKNLLQKQAKLIAKNNWAELTAKSLKYWRLPKILAYTQNICSWSKYMRTCQNICAYPKYLLPIKIYAHILKCLRTSEIFAYI